VSELVSVCVCVREREREVERENGDVHSRRPLLSVTYPEPHTPSLEA
jgi:hypothetical protein